MCVGGFPVAPLFCLTDERFGDIFSSLSLINALP
jgi:hypothetical protein